jgi:hypothetical protein
MNSMNMNDRPQRFKPFGHAASRLTAATGESVSRKWAFVREFTTSNSARARLRRRTAAKYGPYAFDHRLVSGAGASRSIAWPSPRRMGAGWVGGGAGPERAVDTPAHVRRDRGGHTYRGQVVSTLEMDFEDGFVRPPRGETPPGWVGGGTPYPRRATTTVVNTNTSRPRQSPHRTLIAEGPQPPLLPCPPQDASNNGRGGTHHPQTTRTPHAHRTHTARTRTRTTRAPHAHHTRPRTPHAHDAHTTRTPRAPHTRTTRAHHAHTTHTPHAA